MTTNVTAAQVSSDEEGVRAKDQSGSLREIATIPSEGRAGDLGSAGRALHVHRPHGGRRRRSDGHRRACRLMGTEAPPMDLTGMAVALGRIEEKVSHLSGLDDRLRALEQTVTELKTQQKPKAPWWVIVGGMAATVTACAGFWTLFNLASDVASKMP